MNMQSRIWEWSQLDYEQRSGIIDSLSEHLEKDPQLVADLDKAIKEDQDWFAYTPMEFKTQVKKFVKQFLRVNQMAEDYWVSAIEKSVEKITESEESNGVG